jgi:type IV pilus assembly protein PilV
MLGTRVTIGTSTVRGFSLLEVMVALVVLAVGLLGVVKLESVAYSSTNVASKRSIAALQAASLAATMHINRGYWNSPDVSGAIITATNGVLAITASAPVLAGLIGAAQSCTAGSPSLPCQPTVMAAYDLQQWAASVKTLLLNQNSVSTITCGTSNPVSCMINIQWSENTVATNAQETVTLAGPSYTLYVEP